LVTGTINDPFSDIDDAIAKANEACASHIQTCTVTIYLFKITHYLLRGNRDYYIPTKYEDYSQVMSITIKPFPCSISSSYLCTSIGEKVTIVNKRREKF
jgi:hypothetical protein